MKCPQCEVVMVEGVVIIQNGAWGGLFGSTQPKHGVFIERDNGNKSQVLNGRRMTVAWRCGACELTVLTNEDRYKP